MKNSLALAYRSILKPSPLWEEQGVYGGYTYISIHEDMWVSREYEAYVHIMLSDAPDPVKSYAKVILLDSNAIFRPSHLNLNELAKFTLLLKKQSVFAIQGFSLAAEDFLRTINYTKLYTDAFYDLPCTQRVTTEQLCTLSSHMIVLMNSSSVVLKECISNWGNILTYNADSFNETRTSFFLAGGDYGT